MLPLKNFTDFIEQHHLFDRDSMLLVALSGGVDSVALVHLLKAAGYPFAIAHCNFQLRAEANADEEFCRQIAINDQTPFHAIRFNTQQYASANKISIQMAARQLRYQWFEQIRQQHQYAGIALAHHQNDTIETILLNLVRGTGIAGLHGILAKNGNLVRPMLCFTRADIEQIVAENKLAYVEDSSNASVKYARNKLRHEVVPKLKELNPALEQTFENNLRHFRELEQLLEINVAALKEQLFKYSGEEIHISVNDVKQLVPQHLLLFKLLQEYGFNETTVDDVITSLDKHSGRTFESPTGYLLVLDRGKLVLSKKPTEPIEAITIAPEDNALSYGGFKLGILHDDAPLIVKNNPMAVSVDSSKLTYPLTMRGWQQSDHFFPLGMKGKKKLSDFFINLKIPLHQKNAIPLLVNGNGDIIWVGGYRCDERYKVTNNTKKVTIFELLPIGEGLDTI
jgi:tRNA(Ile)-lysidine synthase